MEVEFKAPEESGWRGPGQPRRVIPDDVKAAADTSYTENKVGIVQLGADDTRDDVAELCRLLNAYAASLGRRMRLQRDGNVLRFWHVDRPTRTTR